MNKEKVDWVIHGVHQEDGGIVYHTHGLNEYGLMELELNLPLQLKRATHFINKIAIHLIENNIAIENEYMDEKNIFQCDIYFEKVKGIDGDGSDKIRVVLPDENFLFPWHEGCNETYKRQLNV